MLLTEIDLKSLQSKSMLMCLLFTTPGDSISTCAVSHHIRDNSKLTLETMIYSTRLQLVKKTLLPEDMLKSMLKNLDLNIVG